MSSDKIPTTERLAKAMEENNCPEWMIQKARDGYYDDYKSSIATPCVQLVNDLRDAHKDVLAIRAMKGEFDAQSWESDEWAHSPDGISALADFSPEIKAKLFGVTDA